MGEAYLSDTTSIFGKPLFHYPWKIADEPVVDPNNRLACLWKQVFKVEIESDYTFADNTPPPGSYTENYDDLYAV